MSICRWWSIARTVAIGRNFDYRQLTCATLVFMQYQVAFYSQKSTLISPIHRTDRPHWKITFLWVSNVVMISIVSWILNCSIATIFNNFQQFLFKMSTVTMTDKSNFRQQCHILLSYLACISLCVCMNRINAA